MDAPNNLLTVVRAEGSEPTYDPRRQQGVSISKEQEKVFSVGDRIQFTEPANELEVANRDLGTIQSVTDDGRLALKMDTGRSVSIDPGSIRKGGLNPIQPSDRFKRLVNNVSVRF